jgi:hypothetical protein
MQWNTAVIYFLGEIKTCTFTTASQGREVYQYAFQNTTSDPAAVRPEYLGLPSSRLPPCFLNPAATWNSNEVPQTPRGRPPPSPQTCMFHLLLQGAGFRQFTGPWSDMSTKDKMLRIS